LRKQILTFIIAIPKSLKKGKRDLLEELRRCEKHLIFLQNFSLDTKIYDFSRIKILNITCGLLFEFISLYLFIKIQREMKYFTT